MSTSPARGFRADIQGLRAVAVGLVVLYHVAQERLTGGFVGVDVFFVISGFLITAHLLERPPARFTDFTGFWARRIRRLLPASLLVLVATIVATRLVGPETLWENTARQGGAAALYVVNWLLAGDAVDYLAAENVPTGMQHYWSLSVEEQFYLVWPLLIGLLVWLATRTRLPRRGVLGAGLALVVASSLAWSVHLTGTDPGAAYFVTPTRIWELAVGGVVAVLLTRGEPAGARRVEPAGWRAVLTGPGARAVLGWAGLAAVVYAAVTYDGSTPFPSWTAAVPVLGTAAVILATAGGEWWSPGGVLGLRPVGWLGDISYSVYLWHWPLVVLVGARWGLGTWSAIGIVAATLVLAAATKTWIEDPFRTATWNRRQGASYAAAVAGMAAVLVVAGMQLVEVDRRSDQAEQAVQAALASNDPCLGAGALDPGRDCAPASGPVVPTPARAAQDRSDAYADVSGRRGCWASEPRYPVRTCDFGSEDAARDVVLLGNSHAGQWLPALQELGERHDWRVTTRLASQCASADVLLTYSTPQRARACRDWVRATVQEITRDTPDLVVMSNRVSLPVAGLSREESSPGYTDGYRKVLTQLARADIDVLVLRDTPAPGDGGKVESVPDCLASHGTSTTRCSGPRADWVVPDPDPAQAAVEAVDDEQVVFADLNDRICEGETCQAVVGGVVVYFDASHLTATYARTLAPALADAMQQTGMMPGT